MFLGFHLPCTSCEWAPIPAFFNLLIQGFSSHFGVKPLSDHIKLKNLLDLNSETLILAKLWIFLMFRNNLTEF